MSTVRDDVLDPGCSARAAFGSILTEPDEWIPRLAHVQVLLHAAASVQFEESLEAAFRQNSLGSVAVLSAAAGVLPELKVAVHVSTAYVMCDRLGRPREELPSLAHLRAEERTYGGLVALVNKVLGGSLEGETGSETARLLGNFPNTYCFSKAVSERLLAYRADTFTCPLSIVRPTIVGAAYAEPTPGWIDSVNAMAGAILFTSLRIQREISGIPVVRPDAVPVDRCVAVCLLVIQSALLSPSPPPPGSLTIYHASFFSEAFTWQHVADFCVDYSDRYPPARALNAASGEFHYNPHAWLLATSTFIRYRVPLFVLQTMRWAAPSYTEGVASSVRQLRRLVRAITQTSALFSHFTHNEWRFDETNVRALRESATESTRRRLPTGSADIDAKRYLLYMTAGVHRWVIGEAGAPDPADMLDVGRTVRDVNKANRDRVFMAKLMDIVDSLLLIVPSVPLALRAGSAWLATPKATRAPLTTPSLLFPLAWGALGTGALILKQRLASLRRARRLALGDPADRVDDIVIFQRNLIGLWLNPCVALVWGATTASSPLIRRSSAVARLLFRPLWARLAALHTLFVVVVMWLSAGTTAPPKGTRKALAVALFVLGLQTGKGKGGAKDALGVVVGSLEGLTHSR
jgi:nucleoside-diphosphate-sugar epimerase